VIYVIAIVLMRITLKTASESVTGEERGAVRTGEVVLQSETKGGKGILNPRRSGKKGRGMEELTAP